MYKVNLIKGWKTSQQHRLYRNRILLVMGLVAAVLLSAYLLLFARFIWLQRELTTLTNKNFFSVNGQNYSAEELSKTIYSLKKLEQIKTIFLDYPEYYLYHQFLLSRIYQSDSFTIDTYHLTREHVVKVTLSTLDLPDIFNLITTLESSEVTKYFSTFEISSIEMVKDKNTDSTLYRIDFTLEFNDRLLHENT